MSLQFTNYIEVFKKKNKGIFLFNKLNSTIVFIESNNYIAKQDNLYYIGNNNTDIAFLKEHDFFLSDKEVQNLIIKRSKKISSIKYILSLTNHCNLKCDYCYQSWKDEAISMSTKIIDKFILKLLIDLNTYPEVDDIFINFFGGEPLLNKATIYYALEKFNKIGRDLHKNFYYEIDTNGVFLTKTFLKKFSNLYVSITLSLPDDHNIHRGNGRNHDFFSNIVNNLKNVASVFDDTNFRLSLRYNVHHNNIRDFELFVKFVKNLHIKCFIDAENVDNYPYTSFHNNVSDIEFLQWKATDYIDILLKNGFAVEELPYVSLGRQCAAVHDVGCKMWADGSVGICDFEKFSERQMIKSEREFSCSYLFDVLNKKRFELPEMCLSCYDYPYCGGKKICFDCNGVYKQKRMQRLRIKRYLMRNGMLT